MRPSVAVAEPPPDEEFSFTIAIGRCAPKREDARMLIDVSLPPAADSAAPGLPPVEEPAAHSGLYPVASLDERRLAAIADAACLLFAYGGFLALFGSLGGQFTLSKLSAAVYVTTFAIVYLQYFSLFTIFGGTTPGMMLRGLQVVSFSGEPPTPRQMFLRSAGYVLSAGTFFLGFLWSMWDEDALTWHDRLSHTYLSSAETFADFETHGVAHGR
ncbi:MAG TPA: RDD family protein [Candidatus Acidoferrum sp.]|nr:RDD family protein [Candidatus Acidoferrum sp.]